VAAVSHNFDTSGDDFVSFGAYSNSIGPVCFYNVFL